MYSNSHTVGCFIIDYALSIPMGASLLGCSQAVKNRKGSEMTTNTQRKNGKAWKQKPKVQKKTGKTVDGYSPAKQAIRAEKRKGK